MAKFLGILPTDVYGITMNEMKVGHIQYTAAQMVAADPDGLLDGTALPAEATASTTFLNAMPYARNLTFVCSDTQTGDVTITGTNIADEVITEIVTLTSATPAAGAVAFKTVTSILLPEKVGSETIDVGWGELVGLPYKFAAKPLVFALNDGAVDTTPALTIDDDEIEKNVVDFNGSLDGSVMDLFFVL